MVINATASAAATSKANKMRWVYNERIFTVRLS